MEFLYIMKGLLIIFLLLISLNTFSEESKVQSIDPIEMEQLIRDGKFDELNKKLRAQNNNLDTNLTEDENKKSKEPVAITPEEINKYLREGKVDELNERLGVKASKITKPKRALYRYISEGDFKEDFKEVRSIVDTMSKEELREPLEHNQSVLHVAAMAKSTIVVQGKLKKVDIQPIIKYLIEKGADVNARNDAQQTPLILFARSETLTLPIFDLLIENGADINAVDNYEWSAFLYIVYQSGSTKFLAPMADKGADINIMSKNGDTPLTIAFDKKRNPVYIENLMKAGVDVNHKFKRDNTYMHLAAYKMNISLVNHLLKHGANINSKDSDGLTPLGAVLNINGHVKGAVSFAKEMIKKGANPGAKWRGNKTINEFLDR